MERSFSVKPRPLFFSLNKVELNFIKGSCLISSRRRCILHLRAAEATCTYPCASMYATGIYEYETGRAQFSNPPTYPQMIEQHLWNLREPQRSDSTQEG